YAAYEKILAANHALDFDDLLMRADLLLRDRPDIRETLARRFRYILIDEYQDTNHAQYVFAHGIALDHENICATGDPDQSIYGWRGADIRNIMEFEADYPNAVVIRLERNYRSTRPILNAAGNLIAHNRNRKPKELIATREGGADVEVIRLQDEHDEAREAAEIVAGLHTQGIAYRDMAVFYRVNALSRVLEQAFRKASLPYQIARGVEFYNRKEIKDVLAYLKLLSNPDDNLACERIINVPPRGIGAVTVSRLAGSAETHGVSLLAATGDPDAAGLGKAAAAKVRAFVELMNGLDRIPPSPVRPIVEAVITRSGMEASFRKDEQQRQALRNVQELVSAAREFDEQNPEADLADYLSQVSLVSDIDAVDPTVGAVTFMTLHAAKGLEFPVVIVIGCEEGLLPFQRMGERGRDMEEERRLAFVGMTRAEDRLLLTTARYRMLRGQLARQAVSPFLSEIGAESVTWSDKSDFEAPPRRGALTVDQFNRARTGGGFLSPQEERKVIEALEAAEDMPEEFAGLHSGRRVKSDRFGPGTIQSISYDGTRTRAVILFDREGQKTLILEKAGLEPL
ncbi:MAG: ATP-dependent helicase, partial [Planctomycetota bacterium]